MRQFEPPDRLVCSRCCPPATADLVRSLPPTIRWNTGTHPFDRQHAPAAPVSADSWISRYIVGANTLDAEKPSSLRIDLSAGDHDACDYRRWIG